MGEPTSSPARTGRSSGQPPDQPSHSLHHHPNQHEDVWMRDRSPSPTDTSRSGNAAAFSYHRTVPISADSTRSNSPSHNLAVVGNHPHIRHPSEVGLHLQTDFSSASSRPPTGSPNTPTIIENKIGGQAQAFHANAIPIQASTGLRSAWSTASIASSLSPASALSSPALNALPDITPLPSPMVATDSPPSWRRNTLSKRPSSRGSHTGSLREEAYLSSSPSVSKKNYKGLVAAAVEQGVIREEERKKSHARNRSVSEYQPDPLHNSRPRNVTISNAAPPEQVADLTQERPMQREEYLASQRGIAPTPRLAPSGALPTPPPSNRSSSEADADEEEPTSHNTCLTIPTGPSRAPKHYIPIRELGRGTFSKVILATTTHPPPGVPLSESEKLLPSASLVAIKVINSGPAGNASSSRISLSLRREIDLLRACHHPSLIRLLALYQPAAPSSPNLSPYPQHEVDHDRDHIVTQSASETQANSSANDRLEPPAPIFSTSTLSPALSQFTNDPNPALLVLPYCPGGDLFDLASRPSARTLLTPALVQRIFSELVSAVLYLHEQKIVHRDIKLENVLVNLDLDAIGTISTPQKYPSPLVTLTDLGLGRRLQEASDGSGGVEMLSTRCGSEDYAAPEILLGQPYDGRLTDAWALGVLLYALVEGRLPFDPPPNPGKGARASRSRAAHRVARCEWGWWRCGDEDGEWDPKKGQGWEGAREVVEGLLKKVSRGRKKLPEVAAMEWVREGVQVEGGLRMPTDIADGVHGDNGDETDGLGVIW